MIWNRKERARKNQYTNLSDEAIYIGLREKERDGEKRKKESS
jgi:hypothetical protein